MMIIPEIEDLIQQHSLPRPGAAATRESAVNLPGKFEKGPEEGGSLDGDCLMDTGSRHASNLKG
jgi:hypothetical protein